jgi:hypothetical protein
MADAINAKKFQEQRVVCGHSKVHVATGGEGGGAKLSPMGSAAALSPAVADGSCTDIFMPAGQFLSSALDVAAYYGLMHTARYALVPCGENPESYRLWEALHAGAVPIVETCGDPAVRTTTST